MSIIQQPGFRPGVLVLQRGPESPGVGVGAVLVRNGPYAGVSEAAGLAQARELAFLTSSRLRLTLLAQEPHCENRRCGRVRPPCYCPA